jgi:hypothetical protein
MAGRRRRNSNSTVASIDESNTRYLSEIKVFKPTPPDTEKDDFPSIVLHNAAVYRSDGKTMANPLNSDLEGPYIIRGQLRIRTPEELKAEGLGEEVDEDEEEEPEVNQMEYCM